MCTVQLGFLIPLLVNNFMRDVLRLGRNGIKSFPRRLFKLWKEGKERGRVRKIRITRRRLLSGHLHFSPSSFRRKAKLIVVATLSATDSPKIERARD